MIMLCDTNEVDVYLTMTVDHCLAAKQWFIKNVIEFYIAN